MTYKHFQSGYSEVNGLNMYYEVYGQGKPLLLIHGGGSTIQTSFGRIIPLLAKQRQVIGVELQAHGRTNDRDSELSFEQDADDLATLLGNLDIDRTDVLGFSNGGHTAIEMAIRYPQLLNRIILASTFYKRAAASQEFWSGFDYATLDHMPGVLKTAYLAANNSMSGLLNMFNRDVHRMKTFKGWTDEEMASVKAPTLVINSTRDVGTPEHAVEMFRRIPNCELAIFPGGHGAYLGALDSLDQFRLPYFNAVPLIEAFLNGGEPNAW